MSFLNQDQFFCTNSYVAKAKKGAARLPPQAFQFENDLRTAVLPRTAREGTTQIPSDDELIRARFLS
jgi:hypothetical protein